jgi:hypothetical protein
MKTRASLLAIVAILAVAIARLIGEQAAGAKKVVPHQPALTAAQALPLTCAQAWIASEKSYDRMRNLVIELAKVSLVNRNLTFPNRRDAGVEAGTGIADDCKADPNALLFAVVDKQVRRIAAAAP